MEVLHVENIRKTYRRVTVLDGVSFSLERGRVYGLVGNNGAGKTTLMRIICGLAFADSGELSILGETGGAGLLEARRRTGSLIEPPVYYPELSARYNLTLQSRTIGRADRGEVDELLRMVGLDGVKKPVGLFSTGMKQRYGVAFAMLGRPELLILDEPFNGLDVPGMDAMTEILRGLAADGVTVLISSHLLERLDQVATDYLFMDYGQIIHRCTAEEMHAEIPANKGGGVEQYFRDLLVKNVHDRRERG